MSQLQTLQAIFTQIAEVKDILCPETINVAYRRCRSIPDLTNEEGDQYTELIIQTLEAPRAYQDLIQQMFAAISRSENECMSELEETSVIFPEMEIFNAETQEFTLPDISMFSVIGQPVDQNFAQSEINKGLIFASATLVPTLNTTFPLAPSIADPSILLRRIPGGLPARINLVYQIVRTLASSPLVRMAISTVLNTLFKTLVMEITSLLKNSAEDDDECNDYVELNCCNNQIITTSATISINNRTRYLLLTFLDDITLFRRKKFNPPAPERYDLGQIAFAAECGNRNYTFPTIPLEHKNQIVPVPRLSLGRLSAIIYLEPFVGTVSIGEARPSNTGDCTPYMPVVMLPPVPTPAPTPTPTSTSTPTSAPTPTPTSTPTST